MANMAEITGTKALHKAFMEVAEIGATPSVAKTFNQATKYVRNVIKGEAPKGPTGNLKRSIQSDTRKRFWSSKIEPAGAVYVVGRIAPHFHLVHWGTAGRRVKTARKVKKGERFVTATGEYWTAFFDGRFHRLKSIAPMPANPFFTRGVDKSRNRATQMIMSGTQKAIREAWRQQR